MKRYSKAIAALLGTATPAGIIAIAAFFGVPITPEIAVAIVSFLGVVATILSPANEEKPADAGADLPEISPETHPELYEGSSEGRHAL